MLHFFSRFLIAICTLALLAGCGKNTPPTQTAFYHWQGALTTNDYEDKILQHSTANKVYVRIFDIDFDRLKGVLPVGQLLVKKPLPANIEVVPVIYITQPALKNAENLDSLAVRLIELSASICHKNIWQPAELQLDCDWTQSSRDRYFELLNKVKKHAWMKGKKLSCTIRLHQIKFKNKTGIPPVDRGMLMCYNMGSMLQLGEHNSIVEWPAMKTYIKGLDSYELPLDIALPIYSWILLFEGNKFKGIIYGNEAILQQSQVKKTAENQYQIIADFDFAQYHFRKGETLRHEAATMETIAPLWNYIRAHHRAEPYSLSLYLLDSASIASFGRENVLEIMDKG